MKKFDFIFAVLNFIKNISANESDESLMLDFKSTGDLQILANLYQRYMDLVYGVCLKYLNNNDDAKDATINIYMELIDKLKKYPVDNFKGWLYQLSKNHCLMILRKKKTKPVHIDSENMEFLDDRHPEASQLKEFQFLEMQKCIEQLVDQQKISIELFYIKEKCYKEISEQIGIEINKVKSYIQNGRRNLKICMEKTAIQNS